MLGDWLDYLGRSEKTTALVDGIEVKGWILQTEAGERVSWDLPSLPGGARTEIEQSFASPEGAVEFYRYFCNLIKEIQAEQLLLCDWVKSNPEINGKRVHFAPIEIVNKGTGNSKFPDLNCRKDDFVAEVRIVWNSQGFRGMTAQQCIEKFEMFQKKIEKSPSLEELRLQAECSSILEEIEEMEKQIDKLGKMSPKLDGLKSSLSSLEKRRNEIYALMAKF